ncbi:MAG: DUF2201 family putative metallopeptidase, partial [Hyphomicrobiaceae bacterium]
MAGSTKAPPKDNLKAIHEGRRLLNAHPLFGRFDAFVSFDHREQPFPKDGFARILVGKGYSYYWARLRKAGAFPYVFTLVANGRKRAAPPEWANVLAQGLLHVMLSHVDPRRTDLPWRMACELMAADLLRHLGFGRRPADLPYLDVDLPGRTLEAIADAIAEGGEDAFRIYGGHGVAGRGEPAWIYTETVPAFDDAMRKQHTDLMAAALRANIVAVVETVGMAARGPATARRNPNSPAERARSWFVASYPLLAALAAAFEIVEDFRTCEQLDIRLAAVDAEQRRVYVNPQFPWTEEGMRFVMAHELLHVGLSHTARRQGRDPFLWNVACDYVIDGWLVEMGVGTPPTPGLLLDLALGFERESAEAVYDRIVRDLRLMRRLRKCITMRGTGKPDMLGERPYGWWVGAGCDLDAFYRRAMAEGLDLHLRSGRGTLPGAL